MPRRKKEEETVKEAEVVRMKEAAAEADEVTPETTRSVAQPVEQGVAGQPEQQQVNLEDLKVGYVVGLTEEGDFVFELFGKDPGLVELLGIHQHATNRVQRIYDDKQIAGDRLIHEVGKAVAMLNQRLEQIAQAVMPPRQPDNKLG